jgi:hypothetical protein
MYNRIGRAWLRFAFRYARRRYRREARIALGLGLVGVAVVAYLASREVPEG